MPCCGALNNGGPSAILDLPFLTMDEYCPILFIYLKRGKMVKSRCVFHISRHNVEAG